jgi:hypothetical protein
MKTLRLILVLAGMGLLTACGSSRTIVLQPMEFSVHTAKREVQILRGEDTVCLPEDVRESFEEKLSKKLYAGDALHHGLQVQLQYRFLEYNEENQLAWYTFGGLGNSEKGSLLIEVIYIDADGVEITKIHTGGKISTGIFGGFCSNALDTAADEIASFTRDMIFCDN